MKTPSPLAVSSGYIPALDGFRALAIAFVIESHCLSTISLPSWAEDLKHYFALGTLGVSLFFCLSGYLITTLLLREIRGKEGIDLKGFYARRVLRIFPAFYLYLTVLMALRSMGSLEISNRDFWSAGLFVWNYDLSANSWFLAHFHSLSLEEQFYLFWPPLLVLAGTRRSAIVAVAVIFLAPVSRVATYFMWPESRPHLGMMAHTSIDHLMFGCLAALWQGNATFERTVQSLFRFKIHLIAIPFLLIVSQFMSARFRGNYHMTVGITLNMAAITVLLLWLIRHQHGLVGRIASWRFVVHFGIISYSLYIWQQLFLTEKNTTWTGVFPVNIFVAVIVAECSYWLVERQFLRLKKYFR